MQLHLRDVYSEQGAVKSEFSSWLKGHRRFSALLPNLSLVNQYLNSHVDLLIQEDAPAGLYFSFIGKGPIHSVNDIDSVQISYHPKSIHGQFLVEKNQPKSILQARITPSLLASVLGETEEQIIQHFSGMKEKLGIDNGIIELSVTVNTTRSLIPVLNHQGHAISLAGHIYSLIFGLIEQLQLLSHLSQCNNCQRKLFQAQNLVEMPEHDTPNIHRLAQQVGLNTEALEIGFHLITGQSIERYCLHNRIQSAAAKIRQDPSAKTHILAQSGFSEDQFEAAFIQHFGIDIHQYGQIH
ncbi:AraC family transcriptional regulator [Marinomonas algarum]|uniref:AraC family transcriptional regulator n=1 Tax=Marinomonas algarum TaxID=2883105 RepID=A0A9X1IJI1_9GAMM|nr:AraC family transcriptional regulator [Marinomonas algarum]MCB5160674.1 AraC family transcriptional regulator [Marinomonas algarum]